MRPSGEVGQELKSLFLCIAQAVAQEGTGFRPGARHIVLILLRAADAAMVCDRAAYVAEKHGWLHIDISHSEEVDVDSDLIDNEMLREAVESAQLRGYCVAVDVQEMPLDS